MNHLVSHIHNNCLKSDNKLHVIGVVFNPMRYHSRYRLMRQWYNEMLDTPNVVPYIVELIFGDRQAECTEQDHPNHLRLYTRQEIWQKESLINLGVRYLLPRNWKYMCWSDTDISFRDRNWAQEALHQLQHYALIQPWSDCVDLNFFGGITQHFKSFCNLHKRGVRMQTHPGQPYQYGHSGFAWACRRDWFEAVSGLIDFAILGSADHHMAWASVGHVNWSVHQKMSYQFKLLCDEWQHESFRHTHGHLGFAPTRIEHHFHGPKARRRYRERWQILIDNKFDPLADLTYDSQGLVKLIGKPKLLNDCREYLAFRHEDSIEEN